MFKRKNFLDKRNDIEMYGNESSVNVNGCYGNCSGGGSGGGGGGIATSVGALISSGVLIVQVSND